MAEINQFQLETQKLKSEVKLSENEELKNTLEKLKELKNLKTESQARKFLKENWRIKDDIENLYIASSIRISSGVGKKYYNITYEYSHDEEIDIKSFNFTLDERAEQW